MPYRFELASSNRAGCQNKECKDAKEKIPKGTLRVGSWIDTEKIQAYLWRHWGCATPRFLENIKRDWEEMCDGKPDYSLLDGYDELPEESQEKIRRALDNGHIDDEDWKGDIEMNRPGCRHFRVPGKRAAKAKQDEEAAESPSKADAADKPKKARTSKKNAPNTTESPSKTGAEEANTKKARAIKKVVPATTESPSKADAEVKPAKRGRKKAVKEDANDEEKPAEEDTQPAAFLAASAETADVDGSADAEPKKRGRPAKVAATEEAPAKPAKGTKRKATEKDDKAEEATDEVPKRRGRPAKAAKAQEEPKEAAPSRPKRASRRKAAEAADDDN
ncbi:zf-PARP-domain-containing protein [Penicillium sp. IBT 16267x]|nr:zf-PARP-domain-containing protein [Penicillium sp. IBT 16267x]